jgi:RNA polymerase sigma-70 factor (ECF subfamily)
VYRFTYWRVGQRQLAEDLTQDTFLRALRSIDRFQWQGTDPGAWFITIARNLIYDYYKSARYRVDSNMPTDWFVSTGALGRDPDPTPEDAAVAVARRAALLAAMQRLTAKQRRVIELRYLADLTVAETCVATGWADTVVKSLAFRAIRALRDILADELTEATAA